MYVLYLCTYWTDVRTVLINVLYLIYITNLQNFTSIPMMMKTWMSNNVYIDDLWRRLVAVEVRRCDPHQAGQLKQLHAREFHHHHHHHHLTKTKVEVNSLLNRGTVNQWIPNVAIRRLYSTMNDHRPTTNQLQIDDVDDDDDDDVEVGGVVYTMKGISNNTDIQILVKALSKLAVSSNAPLKGKILIWWWWLLILL